MLTTKSLNVLPKVLTPLAGVYLGLSSFRNVGVINFNFKRFSTLPLKTPVCKISRFYSTIDSRLQYKHNIPTIPKPKKSLIWSQNKILEKEDSKHLYDDNVIIICPRDILSQDLKFCLNEDKQKKYNIQFGESYKKEIENKKIEKSSARVCRFLVFTSVLGGIVGLLLCNAYSYGSAYDTLLSFVVVGPVTIVYGLAFGFLLLPFIM